MHCTTQFLAVHSTKQYFVKPCYGHGVIIIGIQKQELHEFGNFKYSVIIAGVKECMTNLVSISDKDCLSNAYDFL